MRINLQEAVEDFPHVARLVTAMVNRGGAFTKAEVSAAYYAGEEGEHTISPTTLQYLCGRGGKTPVLDKAYREDKYTLADQGWLLYDKYSAMDGFYEMSQAVESAMATLYGKQINSDTDLIDDAIGKIIGILAGFNEDTKAYILSQVK